MVVATSSSKPKPVEEPQIPAIVADPISKKRYVRGRFLGKGGFAKCYELTDMDTDKLFAGKIVSKTLLEKPHQKDKMAQEISIHRGLKHNNIVTFNSFFEDPHNVYIVLEICRRRSLMEMHKRRKAITEPETRYYLKQIVTACKYLHDNNIIHRDLKLGNLFLNDDMELKIGDFGLATKLDYAGERKKTLCGTPNYIAPEVLGKMGHSFEVDVWSLGCIMFTLLVGKPPFETDSLKDTYARIKKNDYHIPSRISSPARALINNMLQQDPQKRPNMSSILSSEFMVDGYIPSRLPTSCLTTAPRFDQHAELSMIDVSRKPLIEVNVKRKPDALIQTSSVTSKVGPLTAKREAAAGENVATDVVTAGNDGDAQDNDAVVMQESPDFYVGDLLRKLSEVVTNKAPARPGSNEDEAEDPKVSPMLWVSKWVDYSDKYGLGYQLSDNSVGILFNDCTKLLLLADGDNIHYIERDGMEHYHTINVFPPELSKKVTLLHYFRNYMNEHLLKTGASMVPRDGDELARLPYLRYWFRTRSAIVMHLTNGTMQINFFDDHTKIIVCPLMEAATYINDKREFRTYRLSGIKQYGCPRELINRLRYARTMAERLATMPASHHINSKPTAKKETVKP